MNRDDFPARPAFPSLVRKVPLEVRLRLLFGGVLNQFGWFVFGVGMIFFWVFATQADLTSWYYFAGPLEEAQGTVLSSERTSYSTGTHRSRTNLRIYAHHYEFTASDGVRRTGMSYASGMKDLTGKQVAIEYPPGQADRSRIKHMRPAVLEWHAAIAGLPSLVGLGLLIAGGRSSRHSLRLLTHGKFAAAVRTGKQPTNWTFNSRPVHELQFTFTSDNGMARETAIRTHETELFDVERSQTLLYNPDDPTDAELLERIHGRPQIDSQGNVTLAHPGRTFWMLILPTIAVLGHGTYAISRFAS